MPKDKSASDDRTNAPLVRKKKKKFVKLELDSREQSFLKPVHEKVWWEAWKENQSVRSLFYDLYVLRTSIFWCISVLTLQRDTMPYQRISEATEVFNKCRGWPQTQTQVRNRWDQVSYIFISMRLYYVYRGIFLQFQVFVGLLDSAAGDDFMKLSTFVQNPAQVIQIYLSSYFIEKGLH